MLDLLKFAIVNARTQFGTGRRAGDSHWIEVDAKTSGQQQQALCGEFVEPAAFSTEPSCVACREAMADVEALFI